MRTRGLAVLACTVAWACMPSVELRPGAMHSAGTVSPGCVAAIAGADGTPRVIDPITLDVRGAIDRIPAQPGRTASIGSTWSGPVVVMVEERGGTATKIEKHPVRIDAWSIGPVEPPLPQKGDCGTRNVDRGEVHALLGTGEPPTLPAGQPRPGPVQRNVVVATLTIDGAEIWRALIPARSGYFFPNLTTYDQYVLRPAAAIAPSGRAIAVIHSDLDGSDHLSVVDVRTREVRTVPLRDERTVRVGAGQAAAKMLERRKAWSPRFADDRYLYAVMHETSQDDLGELRVLLIDTNDGRVVARWPQPMSTIRDTLAGWTSADGSIYVLAGEWAGRAQTLYRLDAKDLGVRAQRTFGVATRVQLVSSTN